MWFIWLVAVSAMSGSGVAGCLYISYILIAPMGGSGVASFLYISDILIAPMGVKTWSFQPNFDRLDMGEKE
jgi:hypothetical protein